MDGRIVQHRALADPSRVRLLEHLRASERSRSADELAADLGLLAPGTPDNAILAAMVEHPVLVNRPIVRTPKGAALCRPSEKVFDLLEQAPDRFVKEDGQVV